MTTPPWPAPPKGYLAWTFAGTVLLYPPQASALCVSTRPVSLRRGPMGLLAFNLAAIATMVGLARAIVREETPNRPVVGAGVLAAVLIGNPFTAHVVWMGQTSLVAFAATFAAFGGSLAARGGLRQGFVSVSQATSPKFACSWCCGCCSSETGVYC